MGFFLRFFSAYFYRLDQPSKSLPAPAESTSALPSTSLPTTSLPAEALASKGLSTLRSAKAVLCVVFDLKGLPILAKAALRAALASSFLSRPWLPRLVKASLRRTVSAVAILCVAFVGLALAPAEVVQAQQGYSQDDDIIAPDFGGASLDGAGADGDDDPAVTGATDAAAGVSAGASAASKKGKKSKPKKQKVRFSEEELARESVLPVFDKTSVVKNRRVSTRGKVELGIGAGTDFLEPFYNKLITEAQLTYHINELHGILLTGTGPWFTYSKIAAGAQCLKTGACASGVPVKLDGLPRIHTFLMGNYQYTTFYSKVSLFKYATLNMMQYFVLGGGVGMLFEEKPVYKNGRDQAVNKAKKYYPAAQLGAGMKFYLNKRIALRIDLKMLMHQWVDLRNYSARCQSLPGCTAKPSRWYTRSMFTAGLSGLLF